MTSSRSRASLVLGGILTLALVALLLILQRGLLTQTTEAPPTIPAEPSATIGPRFGLGQSAVTAPPIATIHRPSLPDGWAAELLDKVTSYNIGTGPDPAARADVDWLPADSLWGILAWTNNGPEINGIAFELNDRDAIKVFVPQSQDFNSLSHIASIEHLANSLTLTTKERDSSNSIRTLTGDAPPDIALESLVRIANTRQTQLLAAYWQAPGGSASLVLIGNSPIPTSSQQLTPTVSNTPPLTQPATSAPTATLVYQPDIKRMLEASFAPFFQISPLAQREVIDNFTQNHSWVGTLTWETNGPYLAGRPLDLATAQQLELFRLDATDPKAITVALLDAQWDATGTTIRTDTDQERYFGFRLIEITHTLITLALENGGQLQAAYDNLGDYRALTIIQYHPLALPPITQPDSD